MRRRSAYATVVLASTALIASGVAATPAGAVNTAQSFVVSAVPANFTPHVDNGTVFAIVQVGNKIITAGSFTSVHNNGSTTSIPRANIFAFDATSGLVDTAFNPGLDGAANSLATDGTSIYVGGSFNTVAGITARKVAKLTAAGALVTSAGRSVLPALNGSANDVVVRGTRLYLGGAFTLVGTATRSGLAAVNKDTGALVNEVNVPFTGTYNGGTTNVKRFDISPNGLSLVAVGNFSSVGGAPRDQVALVDLPATGNAAVSSWATARFGHTSNPNCAGVFDTFTRDLDWAPDGSYFVISTTGAFGGGVTVGTMCDTSSRWEAGRTGTGQQPTWVTYTGGDTTYGVAVTGSAVYLGGHMRWQDNPFQGDQAGPGAVPREGIAALDPVNGMPFSWNPGRTRGVGAQALYATPQGLWVGSDTTVIGGRTHMRLALLPTAGGTTPPTVAAATLANNLFLAGRSGVAGLQRRGVDSSGAPTGGATVANTAIDWSQVRGAFLVNGTLYYGRTDGALYAATFDKTTGALGTPRAVNLYNDPDNGQPIPFAIANLTGMFYSPANHRLYFTVAGDSHLYYRYFTPQSEVVGALTFQANAGSVNFSQVAGMTLAGGRILYGSSADGALRSVAFDGTQVTGAASVASNDASWNFRAFFVPNS